jgi:hypothetical protein
MAFKSFVVFAVVGIASIAASAIDPLAISECGTPPPSTEFLESIQQVTSNGSFIAEASSALSSSSYSSSASGEKQSIITYIHVIASGYQSSDGYISVRFLPPSHLIKKPKYSQGNCRDKTPLTKSTSSTAASNPPTSTSSTRAPAGP